MSTLEFFYDKFLWQRVQCHCTLSHFFLASNTTALYLLYQCKLSIIIMIVPLFLLMLLLGSVTTIINASEAESIGSRPRTVPELIDYWGYPVETHWVTTSDDYILTLHRIPPTRFVAYFFNFSRPI